MEVSSCVACLTARSLDIQFTARDHLFFLGNVSGALLLLRGRKGEASGHCQHFLLRHNLVELKRSSDAMRLREDVANVLALLLVAVGLGPGHRAVQRAGEMILTLLAVPHLSETRVG